MGRHKLSTGKELIKAVSELKDGQKILLQNQEYHFFLEDAVERELYPSNNDGGHRNVAFHINDKKDITIDGNGAKFIFHGIFSPFALENCSNITLRNFSIDFSKPLLYEATVVSSNDKELELFIDKKKFPYEIKDHNIIWQLDGDEVDCPACYIFDYDNDCATGREKYIMAHLAIGTHADEHKDSEWTHTTDKTPYPRFLLVDAFEHEGNILFKYRDNSSSLFYPTGSRLILHVKTKKRDNDTIFINSCENVVLENVIIHKGPAMGVIAQVTKDILLKGVEIRANPGSGELVTTTADSMMFVDCKGDIKIDGCYVSNSVDDGLNVHSTYLGLDGTKGNKIFAHIGHRQQKGHNPITAGDVIEFTSKESRERLWQAVVLESKLLENKTSLEIIVEQEVPAFSEKQIFIENISAQPNVEVVNTEYFRTTCILIGTAGKVRFTNNKVNTLVGSMRIKDDPDIWYESGRINDLIIADNEFLNCGEWSFNRLIRVILRGDARPTCPIHKNIKILNNRFIGKNNQLIEVEYTDGVEIRGNQYIGKSLKEGIEPIIIRECRNCIVEGNNF